jgi:hypothetical protein
VQAAFRAVPRHLFAPEASLEAAYADDVVRTKFDDDGAAIISVSAPWLQATMLEALAALRLVPATGSQPAYIPWPGALQRHLLDLLGVDPTRPP